MRSSYDVVVIGSGPNGLAAAVGFAGAGLSTLVIEGHDKPGGGTRTSELTEPGFLHDVCSAVHPLGIASPWFNELGLDRELDWIEPPGAVAHVLGHGRVVTLERSIDGTAAQLGRDASAYRKLMEPLVERYDDLVSMILAPLRLPRSPLLLARFGIDALRSMRGLGHARFRGEEARALLAGIAAHAMVPLDRIATAAFALVLGAAGHAVGWPIVRGGSRKITDALLAKLLRAGGELRIGERIDRMSQLPKARAYVFDVTPRQLLKIAGDRLPSSYRDRLDAFRYGPGVFKMDWALRGPLAWTDPRCARAATVHLSGTLDDVAATEAAVHAGRIEDRPFTLLVQPTLFDPTRAPPGKHVAWAYCHVPSGRAIDASDAIESHIELFAPGFRHLIIARSTMNPLELAAYNPNYIGGDINGGLSDVRQLLTRPMMKIDPYATPAPDIFLCSSSTPPGPGVHGMCGYWAARSVLARVFRRPADVSEERHTASAWATHRTAGEIARLAGWRPP